MKNYKEDKMRYKCDKNEDEDEFVDDLLNNDDDDDDVSVLTAASRTYLLEPYTCDDNLFFYIL